MGRTCCMRPQLAGAAITTGSSLTVGVSAAISAMRMPVAGALALPIAARPTGKLSDVKAAFLSRFRVGRPRPTVLVNLVLRCLRDCHGEAAARASWSGGGGVVERA